MHVTRLSVAIGVMLLCGSGAVASRWSSARVDITRGRSLLGLSNGTAVASLFTRLAEGSSGDAMFRWTDDVSVSVRHAEPSSGQIVLPLTAEVMSERVDVTPGHLGVFCTGLVTDVCFDTPEPAGVSKPWCATLLDMIPLAESRRFTNETRVRVASPFAASVDTTLLHVPHCETWHLRFIGQLSAADGEGTYPAGAVALSRDTAGKAAVELRGGKASAFAPYHGRLAFGPDPQTSMWVSWTVDTNASVPVVLLGNASGVYSGRYEGTYATYVPADMCGANANTTSILYYLPPGYFGHVLVTGLAPGTRYFAAYGSLLPDGQLVLSNETTFTTGASLDPDVKTSFAAFGDMALSPWPGALSTVENIQALAAAGNVSFALHFGDQSYAEGSTVVWTVWHTYIESLTRMLPYLVSQGNHEVDHVGQPCFQDPSGAVGPDGSSFHPPWGDFGLDSSGEGGVATFHRFRSPGYAAPAAASAPGGSASHAARPSPAAAPSGNGIYWYSFTVGSVHVVQMDSEHDFTPGSAQYAWAASDLASVDHSVTPWIVVTFHRPMVTPEAGSQYTVAQGMVSALEPLFVSHGVDAVLGGHIHSYERVCPMVNWSCTPGGITYITVGTAGATVHNETMVPGKDWLQAWEVAWGFGVMTAHNSSAMSWRWFRNQDSTWADEAWIRKPPSAASATGRPPPTSRNGGGSAVPVAAGIVPEQIHLTLSPDSDALVVAWTDPLGASGTLSLVRSGESPDALNATFTGSATSYANDLCPTNSSRTVHVVPFAAPRGAATYYQVSSDNATWSPVFRTSGIAAPGEAGSFSLSVFGDMGADGPGGTCALSSIGALADASAAGEHALIVHYGDSAYNMDDGCGATGDVFLRAAQSYAAVTPVSWGNGNHEGGPMKQYTEYLRRLSPGQAALGASSGSNSTRWYGFSAGLVSFFHIDADAWIYPLVWPLAGPQWEWLDGALGRVNRTLTPWVVVFGHRAMYCTKTTDPECNSEAETLRYGFLGAEFGLEALLVKHGVDLYFAGHTHHYERTWPVVNGTQTQRNYVNPRGPVHVQSGIAGVDGFDAFAVAQQPWEAFRDTEYRPSFTRLTFFNASLARLQQLHAANGSAFDEFTLVQASHGPFTAASPA